VYSSLLAAVKNLGVPRLQLDGSFHHALQTGRHQQQQQQGVVSPRKNERKTKKKIGEEAAWSARFQLLVVPSFSALIMHVCI